MLSAKEFENLLKVCTKYGVAEYRSGDLHVVFGSVATQTKKPSQAVMRQAADNKQKADLNAQFSRVADEISTSHIEDPSAFEDQVAKGLLVDEET